MTSAFAHPAQIGPNAIVRTLEAMRERAGDATADAVMRRAGLERYAREAPAEMVPEAEVIALYRAMRADLGRAEADANARLAGEKTADYLLAHRIPRAAQTVLRLLPPRVAAPVLLAAIGKHTWTFAGSGVVRARAGRPASIAIEACPMCRETVDDAPVCTYYAATFERLFRTLVSGRARAVEVTCAATGADRCTFEIRY